MPATAVVPEESGLHPARDPLNRGVYLIVVQPTEVYTMATASWRPVERFSDGSVLSADMGAVDAHLQQQGWRVLRLESAAGAALALPAECAGVSKGAASEWLLVVEAGAGESDIAELRRAVQKQLPAKQRVGYVGVLRGVGGPTAPHVTVLGDTGIGMVIERLPPLKPALGRGVEVRKAPEGGLSGRESWFRDRTGRRSK